MSLDPVKVYTQLTNAEAAFLAAIAGSSYQDGDLLELDTDTPAWTSTPRMSNLRLLEGSAPAAESGYGKLYVKSSDSKLYFKDDSGTEYDLTAATSGNGITWNEVTGTSQTASLNNGYVVNNASQVTITLPASASVGDVVRVVGKGAGGWKIAQNAGQSIQFGGTVTTTGTGGSLESVERYDVIILYCITANTGWSAQSISDLIVN